MQRLVFFRALAYRGNLIWMVIVMIVRPTLLVPFCLKNLHLCLEGKVYCAQYRRKPRWLYFWAILFPAVMFLLLFIWGVDVFVEEEVGREPSLP